MWEAAILNFYDNNVQTADARFRSLSPRAQQFLKEARETAECAECQQRISTRIEWQIRDSHVFHPSCARRYDQRRASPQTQAAPRTQTPTIIGVLCGIGLPFGEQCYINTPTGDRMETYAHDAFARSIAEGKQSVQVDHDNAPIPGDLTVFADNKLSFRLRVHDTPRGRTVLEQARRGEFRGCSVRFTPRKESYVHSHLIRVDEADLREISLCRRVAPAWHSTAVWIES